MAIVAVKRYLFTHVVQCSDNNYSQTLRSGLTRL